jgi:hypothetical protein
LISLADNAAPVINRTYFERLMVCLLRFRTGMGIAVYISEYL